MNKTAKKFMELFDGKPDAYGFYKVDKATRANGEKVKGKAITYMKPVTVELWESHLGGERLGIVPIRNDNTVRFGAIDIDEYSGLSHGKLAIKIEELKLPLIVCRSKSGGAHLYCFTKEPVPAYIMREKLKEFCVALGHGKNPVDGRETEIFPKQDELHSEKDVGNWINMPYCGGVRGMCYAVFSDESAMSESQFLKTAKRMQLTLEELSQFTVDSSEEFREGPPCIGFLAVEGVGDGSRNKGLFAFGVYARKAFPDNWQSRVEDYNRRIIQPSLDSSEVQTIIKSLNKKDYSYPCDESPIADHCNSDMCRLRKYGIGPDIGQLPDIRNLRKVNTRPPIWFVAVNQKTVQLTTEDLQTPLKFQRRCLEQINLMPPLPKKNLWTKQIQDLLMSVHTIEVPEDSSNDGQLIYYLEQYCTGNVRNEDRDELLTGSVWWDLEGLKPAQDNNIVSGARYWFNMAEFLNFLYRNNFRDYKAHGVTQVLKHPANAHMNPIYKSLRIKGKVRSYWSVLADSFSEQTEPFNIPKEIVADDLGY